MSNPIYPCLWFDGRAREAAEFYCATFPNSKIFSDTGMVVNFALNGSRIMALNGGTMHSPTPANSYVIECDSQTEIDHYWEKLGEGGRYEMCGWLVDKFGFSWQVIPAILGTLMSHPERGPRVIDAFLKMQKFDIETLLKA
jgi:predicted 3-demethylubiquinone-9 3-methyltransferase (glyoxalase superfamily)